MLREVLTQVEPANLLRLLTWFFSTAGNPSAAPTHPLGQVLATAMQLRVEAFVDNTTPRLESSHAPLSAALPVPTQANPRSVITPSIVYLMNNVTRGLTLESR